MHRSPIATEDVIPGARPSEVMRDVVPVTRDVRPTGFDEVFDADPRNSVAENAGTPTLMKTHSTSAVTEPRANPEQRRLRTGKTA